MKHRIIAITTDFGDSFAVAQLHAVVESLGFKGKIIENHSTHPFAIHSGAFEIFTLSQFCPDNTVFLGVVDPGVGSSRAGIIIKTNNFWFVGPDNGLLYPSSREDGIMRVWKINEGAFDNVTNTFHGRDVFIKVAVLLAKGHQPEDFGSTLIDKSTIKPLEFKNGQVLHIDAYGNVKIFFDKKISIGEKLEVGVNGLLQKMAVVKTFADVNKGQELAYLGSSNTLELAINQGNYAQKHGIKAFDIIDITKI